MSDAALHAPPFAAFLRNAAIPLRVRKKLGKQLRPAAGITFSTRLFDLRYNGCTGNHIDDKVYLYGVHESSTLRLMRHILATQRQRGIKTVLVDVGTNSGVHLLSAAPFCDQVFGFEPWARVRERALKNINDNALHHVTMFDFGLSDADEELPFLEPVGNNLGIGAFVKGDLAAQELIQSLAEQKLSAAIPLRVRVGDAVMGENNITPSLIKIDTEGFEKHVLAGLHATLGRARPAIVFEYSTVSRRDFDPPGALEAAFGPGYQFYGILPSRECPVLRPFKPGARYENVLAWPGEQPALPVYRRVGDVMKT
jgi:FkbM family methyltransferase